jgi:hypothetical protein
MYNEDKILEVSLIKSLRSKGFLLPESEEDFNNFDTNCKNNKIAPIPAHLNNTEWMISLEYNNTSFPTIISDLDSSGMAMAARDGKEIPKDILDKMKKDKDESRKDGK